MVEEIVASTLDETIERVVKLQENLKFIREIRDDYELVSVCGALMEWFNKKNLGNPFNYNRGLEYYLAVKLGLKLTQVGGGSDAYNPETGETAEFKCTEYKGLKNNGTEKIYRFAYNGTTKKNNFAEQEDLCRKKIMRDPFHYWSIIDYKNGNIRKTYKINCSDVWKLIWPKWQKAFVESSNRADPRITGSISTKELDDNNILYEIIIFD